MFGRKNIVFSQLRQTVKHFYLSFTHRNQTNKKTTTKHNVIRYNVKNCVHRMLLSF